MMQLNLPSYEHDLIEKEGKYYIYDIIRKKHIVLSSEEWVRQHMIHYLIKNCKYPASLMSVEHSLSKQGRADIVIYQPSGNIYMIIECKKTNYSLRQSGLGQLARYHAAESKAPFITITNGLKHFVFAHKKSEKGYVLLSKIPSYCRKSFL